MKFSYVFGIRQDMLDSRSFRSAGSERSDDMSLRSIRRTGMSYKREKMPVSVGIITVILFIAGGAILFAIWEDWNLFDGAYYSFITLRLVHLYLSTAKQSITKPVTKSKFTFDYLCIARRLNIMFDGSPMAKQKQTD